ncbi:MAG TPA: hypothetical protein DCQ77_00840, partial [Betaproteobacteria bacterium]|nr:hypothetical protein [Betaproteobacteria bacterium]
MHPLYAELKAATGNAHSAESDLFFPDLSLRAPKTAAAVNLSDAELKDLIKKSRSQFQRGLLGFLRQQNADQGLAAMRSAVHQIELAMALPANRTLWWGTTAFVDCLINHAIEPDFAVKQLCGRIDLQMRRQAEGSFQVAERLFKDILYFVAKSAHVSAHVTQVKKTFALDSLIPSGAGENTEMATLQPLLTELRKLLAPAKETWLKFSAGNHDSLAQFHAQIMQLQDRTAALKSTPLQLLLAQVASTTTAILPAERLDSIGLEVATALLLIQNTLENYQHVTGELVQQADVQVQRLRAAAAGELDTAHIPDVPLLDEMSRQAQERLLIAQVAHEVQTNLQQIEETLDAFFRDPRNERAALAQVHSPLAQVQGALSILQLDDASQMLQAARATITQFSDATRPVDEADFSLVADALSSLGLYVDALRHQRSDAQQILLPVLRKMGLVAPAPEAKIEPDTAATEHSVEAGLDALKLDVHTHLNAWQSAPEDTDSQKKLVDSLLTLSQDAELVGDHVLKQHTAAALQLVNDDDNAAVGEILLNLAAPEAPPTPIETHATHDNADAVDAELLQIFLEEASEVLDTISSQLAISRAAPRDHDSLTTLRRSFHTLKGSGRMVGLNDLGEAAWGIEQLLNQWLQEDKPASPALLDVLTQAHTQFADWITSLNQHGYAVIDAAALGASATQLRSGTQPAASTPDAFVSAADSVPAESQQAETIMPASLTAAVETTDSATPIELPSFAPLSWDTPAHTPEDSFAPDLPSEADNAEKASPADVAHPAGWNAFAPVDDDRIAIGVNLIARPLLDIFLREADQHCATLQTEYTHLCSAPNEIVGYDFMRAAHTLGGIAGTTGFVAVAELGHALERWLAHLHENNLALPTQHHLVGNAISRLHAMLQDIRALQATRPAHELITALAANEPGLNHNID